MSKQQVRYFTPEEANALLPRLAERLEALGSQVRQARSLSGRVDRLGPEERAEARESLKALERRAQVLLDAVREEGVHVKGIEPALLDFPALRNGQEVYLCWREGEERVAYWHSLQEGFTGRQPLAEDRGDVWEWCN